MHRARLKGTLLPSPKRGWRWGGLAGKLTGCCCCWEYVGGSRRPPASGHTCPASPSSCCSGAAGSRPGRLAAFLAFRSSHAPCFIYTNPDAERPCSRSGCLQAAFRVQRSGEWAPVEIFAHCLAILRPARCPVDPRPHSLWEPENGRAQPWMSEAAQKCKKSGKGKENPKAHLQMQELNRAERMPEPGRSEQEVPAPPATPLRTWQQCPDSFGLVGLLFSQSSILMELCTLAQGWCGDVLSPALPLCRHRHFPLPFPQRLTGFHHQHRLDPQSFIPCGSCSGQDVSLSPRHS